jgi:predicted RNase H-like HicB family nuclease
LFVNLQICCLKAPHLLSKMSGSGKDSHLDASANFCSFEKLDMKIKVVVQDAEEGGFWAEVPAIPGCATQGDTMEELLRNLQEAIEGCLSVDVAESTASGAQHILEIAV